MPVWSPICARSPASSTETGVRPPHPVRRMAPPAAPRAGREPLPVDSSPAGWDRTLSLRVEEIPTGPLFVRLPNGSG